MKRVLKIMVAMGLPIILIGTYGFTITSIMAEDNMGVTTGVSGVVTVCVGRCVGQHPMAMNRDVVETISIATYDELGTFV
jgi:hypothetical protein